MPEWLVFDQKGVFKGVPSVDDTGIYYISVTAVSPGALYKSSDVFAIEVIENAMDAYISEKYVKVFHLLLS